VPGAALEHEVLHELNVAGDGFFFWKAGYSGTSLDAISEATPKSLDSGSVLAKCLFSCNNVIIINELKSAPGRSCRTELTT
jgi:hypothetical protein